MKRRTRFDKTWSVRVWQGRLNWYFFRGFGWRLARYEEDGETLWWFFKREPNPRAGYSEDWTQT